MYIYILFISPFLPFYKGKKGDTLLLIFIYIYFIYIFIRIIIVIYYSNIIILYITYISNPFLPL